MLYGKGLEGMTQSAAGVNRGAPTASRKKIEALIPVDDTLRKRLRAQWHNPSKHMNEVPLRYVDEAAKADYFVVGWNGANTVVVLHEGRFSNMSLTTLARRRVQVDLAWKSANLGALLEAKSVPAPVLNESEVVAATPRWYVCRGVVRKLNEDGEVTLDEVWNAYQSIDDVPLTYTFVGKVDAPDRQSAVKLMQEQSANKNAIKPARYVNYSSRRGDVQSLDEILGL